MKQNSTLIRGITLFTLLFLLTSCENDSNNTNNFNNANNSICSFKCTALPAPTRETTTVTAEDADSLRNIIENASSGTTIQLEDGYYNLGGGDSSHRLIFATPNLTLRSVSGNPENVILDGNYVTGELISIQASDVTIADITLQKAYYHPVHISGTENNPIENILLHNLRIIDPGEQAIKINPIVNGYTDYGIIQCSHLELTDEGRPHIRNNCYTGGIDAHKSQGWIIRNNFIKGFWCENGLAEHGIHMWQSCRDTLVENNIILDCARGIGLGMGESGDGREYEDNPYPEQGYLGHIDGLIRNNFIAASSENLFNSATSFDAGITLEQAHGAIVVHNTVASSEAPFSSIEWRWDNTSITLKNNLVSHNLRDRGGFAELGGNIENAALTLFMDLPSGNLHLTVPNQNITRGEILQADICPCDIDQDLRPVAPQQPLQGADEP
ncbi:MAG: hypothetical protein PF689_08560 [Deltaproteobacteria bacterium]|jgi:hypothetical protein|nr:hypothetical protein [Deltaproteobacteria bacterium]